jgi:hypothetical protein
VNCPKCDKSVYGARIIGWPSDCPEEVTVKCECKEFYAALRKDVEMKIRKSIKEMTEDFFIDYFGKEKYDSFAKFCSDRGLSGEDFYQAAKNTKWKIENGSPISKEAAEAYLWKILWNKVRTMYGGGGFAQPIQQIDEKPKKKKQPELIELPKRKRRFDFSQG